jgi:hypothetical protein
MHNLQFAVVYGVRWCSDVTYNSSRILGESVDSSPIKKFSQSSSFILFNRYSIHQISITSFPSQLSRVEACFNSFLLRLIFWLAVLALSISNMSGMQIFVKTLTGKTITLVYLLLILSMHSMDYSTYLNIQWYVCMYVYVGC